MVEQSICNCAMSTMCMKPWTRMNCQNIVFDAATNNGVPMSSTKPSQNVDHPAQKRSIWIVGTTGPSKSRREARRWHMCPTLLLLLLRNVVHCPSDATGPQQPREIQHSVQGHQCKIKCNFSPKNPMWHFGNLSTVFPGKHQTQSMKDLTNPSHSHRPKLLARPKQNWTPHRKILPLWPSRTQEAMAFQTTFLELAATPADLGAPMCDSWTDHVWTDCSWTDFWQSVHNCGPFYEPISSQSVCTRHHTLWTDLWTPPHVHCLTVVKIGSQM